MRVRSLFVVCMLLVSLSAGAQTTYQEWFDAGQPNLNGGTPATAAPGNRGGLGDIFPDRTSFNNAVGILPLEGFEDGATPADGVNTCDEPVNSSSNDVCFLPGDLIDGFDITSSGGSGIVVLGDGFIGQASDVVGANDFGEFATVAFTDNDVTAVALDVFSGAPTDGGDVTVRAFGLMGDFRGSVVVTTTASNVSEFVGFTSPVPVSRIEIEGAGGSGELFDNLTFGAPVPDLPESQPVPTLGIYGMIAAAIMLLLVAGVVLRRRSSN